MSTAILRPDSRWAAARVALSSWAGPLALATLAVASGVALRWRLYGDPLPGVDDANIYFTYAHHVVNGQGFTFAPGGERVEGFTSPAWMALCILAFAFTSLPEAVLLAVSGLCVIAALALAFRWLKAPVLSLTGTLFGSAVIVAAGFLDWTILSRLETGLWTLAVTAPIGALARRWEGRPAPALPFLIALLVVTRPESLAWGVFLCGLHVGVGRARGESWSTALRASSLPLLAFAGTALILTLVRLVYFGYPLPNTYYSKVSSDLAQNLYLGAAYAVSYLREMPLGALGVALGLASLALLWRLPHRPWTGGARLQTLAALTLLLHLGVPLAEGGDHFRLFRMYQPMLPLALLVVLNTAFWAENLGTRRYLRRAPAVALVAAGTLELLGTGAYLRRAKEPPLLEEFALTHRGRQQGRLLNTVFLGHEKPRVAAIAVGGLALAYEGPIFDLMGLNHVRMAHADRSKKGLKNHASFNRGVFYEEGPEMFVGEKVAEAAEGQAHDESRLRMNVDNLVLRDLFFHTRFVREYQPVVITPFPGCHYRTYARNEWIDDLRRRGFQVAVLERVP